MNLVLLNLGVCSGVGFCSSVSQIFFICDYVCVCCDVYKGRYCEEFDSCYLSRNLCKNGVICIDIKDGIVDSFNCMCIFGYMGIFCEINIDECSFSLCVNGFCVDYINVYLCLCDLGFNGLNCYVVILDLCVNNLCRNGGLCE